MNILTIYHDYIDKYMPKGRGCVQTCMSECILLVLHLFLFPAMRTDVIFRCVLHH